MTVAPLNCDCEHLLAKLHAEICTTAVSLARERLHYRADSRGTVTRIGVASLRIWFISLVEPVTS